MNYHTGRTIFRLLVNPMIPVFESHEKSRSGNIFGATNVHEYSNIINH